MKILRILLAMTAIMMLTAGCKDDEEGDVAPPADADYTNIVLNEVCGAGPLDSDPQGEDDWVEIYNKGAEAVNLAGVTILKTDEEGKTETIYIAPASSSIAGGAYKVVKYSSNELSAKISNKKPVTITLAAPSGTKIDEFDRDAAVGTDKGHAPGGSYARIPNGTGAWAVVSASTAGAANAADEDPEPLPDVDYSGIALNEICGAGPVASDPDGEDDWVEIYNKGTEAVNLAGVTIVKTDETNTVETIYTAPAQTTLAAGAYLVLRKSDDTLLKKISNKKQVVITLKDPSGDTIDAFDRDAAVGTDKGHAPGGSYARIPNGTGAWAVVSASTAGSENVAEENPEPLPDVDYTGLALNELNGNDKFIELYNGSDAEMDISGVQLKKDADKIVYVAPSGTKIASKGFLKLDGGAADYNGGFTSGLSADKSVLIELLDPDGGQLDVFKNLSVAKGETWGEDDGKYNGKSPSKVSFARYPDGIGGKWYMATSTPGAANVQGSEKITW